MREANIVLRLKRFEATQRALKICVLETMILDFDNTALDLARQIAAEEERTRIKDTRHVAYSTLATAAAFRRRNVLMSVRDLKPKLEAAKRELHEVTVQLRDLELAQSLVPHSAAPLTATAPSPPQAFAQASRNNKPQPVPA